MTTKIEEAELGHGERVNLIRGRLRIRWLGEEREVIVLVSGRKEPTREGEPIMPTIETVRITCNRDGVVEALNQLATETQGTDS